jgi:hypothetical protein
MIGRSIQSNILRIAFGWWIAQISIFQASVGERLSYNMFFVFSWRPIERLGLKPTYEHPGASPSSVAITSYIGAIHSANILQSVIGPNKRSMNAYSSKARIP